MSDSGMDVRNRPVMVGIAGGSGSGKTTVAERILETFAPSASLIAQDRFYRQRLDLTLAERQRLNYDHPDAFDSDLLLDTVKQLLAGQDTPAPTYSFTQHQRLPDWPVIRSRPLLILEGILILQSPRLRELMDLRIFIDTDADIRFIRRLRRDMTERGRTVESIVTQYMRTVKPMHEAFVEPSKRYAHILLPEGGFNETGVQTIVAKVRELLNEQSPRA